MLFVKLVRQHEINLSYRCTHILTQLLQDPGIVDMPSLDVLISCLLEMWYDDWFSILMLAQIHPLVHAICTSCIGVIVLRIFECLGDTLRPIQDPHSNNEVVLTGRHTKMPPQDPIAHDSLLP